MERCSDSADGRPAAPRMAEAITARGPEPHPLWAPLLRHARWRDNLMAMKSQRDMPLNILRETYRPLAFWAGELLLAASPFLPRVTQTWARRLIQFDSPSPSNR